MTKCMVNGCPNTSRRNSHGTGVTLHSFPNTLDRIKMWLQQIAADCGDLDSFAQRVLDTRKSTTFRICSVHFSPESYVWEGKKLVLRKDALPTIFHECNSKGSLEKLSDIPPGKRVRTETLSDGEEKSHPTQWRLCPKTRTLIMEKEQNAHRRVKKMVDASTSTDRRLFQVDVGTQWPEYEFNFDGEPWKVKHDHYYPSMLHPRRKSTKKQKKRPAHHDKRKKSFVVMQQAECPDVNTANLEENENLHNKNSGTAPVEPTHNFPEEEMALERKFIVFESCLDDLFYKLACQFGDGCRAPIVELQKYIDGTFLSVNGLCRNGHHFHLWNSQTFTKNIAVGNLLIASAVLFSGSTFIKVQEMSQLMGLQQISATTYSNYQQRFLFPTVDSHWLQERQRLKEALTETPLTLSASSHHGGKSLSDKHCTCVLLDTATKRIVDFQIQKLLPKKSRYAVERKAFHTCLSRLLNEKFSIKTVATDQNPSIKKAMAAHFPHLRHEYDVWQYTKRLQTYLRSTSRKRLCSKLAICIPSVTNHLCWSSYMSQGNVHVLRERWRSLLPHIVGDCSQVYPKNCSPHPILKRDSPAFQELRELVLSTSFSRDLTCMSQFSHRGEIQVYRNFTLKFRPKWASYKSDALEVRTKLSILAHNATVQQWRIKFSNFRRCSVTCTSSVLKSRHHHIIKQADHVAVPEHFLEMICDVLKLCTGNVRPS